MGDDDREDKPGELVRPVGAETPDEAGEPLATEDEERDDPEQGFGQLAP